VHADFHAVVLELDAHFERDWAHGEHRYGEHRRPALSKDARGHERSEHYRADRGQKWQRAIGRCGWAN
jgi:hypothetical protein